MRIAYLDCFSGISGDMFLGAVVDAGVSAQLLENTVASLDVGVRLEVSRVDRSGISATKVNVLVGGESDRPRELHSHRHTQSHSAAHEHAESHAHEHGRNLRQIRAIISRASLSAAAKTRAISMFEALGAAEAKIHNTDMESIHFHEVGAADALADIVGAAVGSEALRVDSWICSPLNVGGGTVACAHGTFPVPAPATVELLRGAPVYSTGLDAELVTPTGAAIVHSLVDSFAPFPRMKIQATGYGAGTRDLPGHANVLRLTVGERQEEPAGTRLETISVIEATLDDLNPQLVGYVTERALAEGALDVFTTAVQMKKNRPGVALTVLTKPEDSQRLANLIFKETTTLGLRMREERRQTLARRWVRVQTRWGEVRMKLGNLNGDVTHYAPEYEDCRRIAEEHQVPLRAVIEQAVRQYVAGEHSRNNE